MINYSLAIIFDPITSKPTQARPNQKLLVSKPNPQIPVALPANVSRCISLVGDGVAWAPGAGGTRSRMEINLVFEIRVIIS